MTVLSYDPALPIVGIYPKNIKTLIEKDILAQCSSQQPSLSCWDSMEWAESKALIPTIFRKLKPNKNFEKELVNRLCSASAVWR